MATILTYQGVIQFRHGLAADWTSYNIQLAEAELGFETDTKMFKIGDGTTLWNDLGYGGMKGPQGVKGDPGLKGDIGLTGPIGPVGATGDVTPAATAAANTAAQQAAIGAAAALIYSTTAAGVNSSTGVASGKYFFFPSPATNGSFDVYLNNAGVAQFTGITLPNLIAVTALQKLFSGAGITVGDDIFWSLVLSADANGNVGAGIGFDGVLYAMQVNFASATIGTLNGVTSLPLGQDTVLSFGDYQYDVVWVDKNNKPYMGTIDGKLHQMPSNLQSPMDAMRMYGGDGIIPAPVVSYRPGQNQNTNNDAGQTTAITYVAARDFNHPRIRHANITSQAGFAPNNVNKVWTSLEYPLGSGKIYQGIFPNTAEDGSYTLQPREHNSAHVPGMADTIIPKGSLFRVYSTIVPGPDLTTGAAGVYPQGGIMTQAGAGFTDGVAANNATNMTLTGLTGTVTYGNCYTAASIHGTPQDGGFIDKLVLFAGDSIIQGAGGSTNFAMGLDGGWANLAAQMAGVPYINQAANGIRISSFGPAAGRKELVRLAAHCSVQLHDGGTNDLADLTQTAATVWANIVSYAQAIRSTGCRVIGTTIPPRNKITNGDTAPSATNQVAYNANFGPEGTAGSERTKLNTLIRAGKTSGVFDEVYDVAAKCEVYNATTDTWQWAMPYVGDLTHPDGNACVVLAVGLVSTNYLHLKAV